MKIILTKIYLKFLIFYLKNNRAHNYIFYSIFNLISTLFLILIIFLIIKIKKCVKFNQMSIKILKKKSKNH
jgi:hypothetical protein